MNKLKLSESEESLLRRAVIDILGSFDGDKLVLFLSSCQSPRIQEEIKKDIEFVQKMDNRK